MDTDTPYSHVCFMGNVPRLMNGRQLVMICAHFHEIPGVGGTSCHLSVSSVTDAAKVF